MLTLNETIISFEKDDPYEQDDLAGDSKYSDKLNELKQRLADEINNNYVAPLPEVESSKPPPEINPDDPNGMVGLAMGGCEGVDKTMP